MMLGLILIVASIVLAELALHWCCGAPSAEKLPLLRVKADPVLGYRPLPGQTHFGYEQPITLNSLGLRGPDVPRNKPDNEKRVLLVGDTQVYGIGLPDNALMSHVAEQNLNSVKIHRNTIE